MTLEQPERSSIYVHVICGMQHCFRAQILTQRRSVIILRMIASAHCLFRQRQVPIIRYKCSSRTDLYYSCNIQTHQQGKTNLSHDGLNPAHVPYQWVNNPTLGEFCFAMIGRADIEGSKSNVAMNAWLPQASYPCGNFSDTSS